MHMRKFMVVVAMLIGVHGAHAADPVLPPGDQAAIRATIERQFEAFRHDDGTAAFAEAAPNIRGMFGTADNFMEMVRRGYPPVYRPRSADFTDLAVEDGQFVQHVEVVGPDGHGHTALYTMVRNEAGEWRIAGCTLVDSARLGV